MKRIADYLVLALCVTLWGCEELLPVVPVEPPVENKMVTINAVAGENGTIDPSGVSKVNLGDSMIYFIKPDTNYDIMSIKVDGVEQPIDDTFKFNNVLSNRSINVEFIYVEPKPIVKKFTVETVCGSNGTISPSGKFEVDSGTVVTFIVQPNVGFDIDSILVNGIKSPLIDSTYTLLNIDKNYTITPIFKKDVLFWLIAEKPWIEDLRLVFLDGSWVNFTTNPWVYYFLPNGSTETYWDGKLIGNGSFWYIDQSTTPPIFHDAVSKDFPKGESNIIEKLDKDSFVVVKDNIKVVLKHP